MFLGMLSCWEKKDQKPFIFFFFYRQISHECCTNCKTLPTSKNLFHFRLYSPCTCTVGLARAAGHLSRHHILLHVDAFVLPTSVVPHTAWPFITETNSIQWMICPACISRLHRAQCAFRSLRMQAGGWMEGWKRRGGIGWRNSRRRGGERSNAQSCVAPEL